MARGRNTDQRRRSQRWGQWAEWLAAGLLLLKGYRVVERRHKTPVGEIDLIARRGRTIIFVEVKARGTIELAAHAITHRQRDRIARAAQYWLSQNSDAQEADLRFDAILVASPWQVHHVKDAFQA